MYKVTIGDDPNEECSAKYGKSITKETPYYGEVIDMVQFALRYGKSVTITGVQEDEISLEGIEEGSDE